MLRRAARRWRVAAAERHTNDVAFLVHFTTSRFDVAAETPNPINPIAGQGVLLWIAARIASHGYRSSAPDAEDWGWYMDVTRDESRYLVGASGEDDAPDAPVEWVVQIHPHRSFKDRLLGRNKPSPDDPLFALIERLARDEPDFTQVETDVDA